MEYEGERENGGLSCWLKAFAVRSRWGKGKRDGELSSGAAAVWPIPAVPACPCISKFKLGLAPGIWLTKAPSTAWLLRTKWLNGRDAPA